MTVVVVAGVTHEPDLAATRTLQSVASPWLDVLANANTLFGQPLVTVVLAAALAYVAWRREPGRAWLAVLLFGMTAGVGVLMKFTLVHPPPPEEFDRAVWLPLSVDLATPSAFPSGHIARITFLAIFAAGLVHRRWAWVLTAAFVGYTFWARIYVGDHWLSDGIGGLALGVATGCAALFWIESARGYARRV